MVSEASCDEDIAEICAEVRLATEPRESTDNCVELSDETASVLSEASESAGSAESCVVEIVGIWVDVKPAAASPQWLSSCEAERPFRPFSPSLDLH